MLGQGDPDTLRVFGNLGTALAQQGRLEEAEQMHRLALEGLQGTLGLEHPDTLASLNTLGATLRQLGKLEEAEQVERQALEAAHAGPRPP